MSGLMMLLDIPVIFSTVSTRSAGTRVSSQPMTVCLLTLHSLAKADRLMTENQDFFLLRIR